MVRALTTGVLVAAAACATIFSPLASAGPSRAHQFQVTLEVGNHLPRAPYGAAGQKRLAIMGFRYLVNLDNTGDSSDSDPTKHPGVHQLESFSPVVASGVVTGARTTLTLPEGRYLVTVSATSLADSSSAHKTWGVHIRLPEEAETTKRVDLIPLPLPLGRIVARVFEDVSPLNGTADVAEVVPGSGSGQTTGLGGFAVVLRDASGNVVARQLTREGGTVVIQRLPPGRYRISATPPSGTEWRQTTTFEGAATLEARVMEGEPAEYRFGFARPLDFSDPANLASQGRSFSGRIEGCAKHWVRWGPFDAAVFDDREPFQGGWVALSAAGSDRVVYAGPLADAADCGGAGIDIEGVPPGAYSMFLWDEELTAVSRQVRVFVPPGPGGGGEAIRLPGDDGEGNLGLFRRFGWLSGRVYDDLNANGVRDLAPTPEPGVAGVDVELRARDGSLEQATTTDTVGFYEFAKVLSRLSKFDVAEVGLPRFSSTGPSLHSEYTQHSPGDRGVVLSNSLGGGLVTAQLTTEGHRSAVDWGRRAGAGETGEIAGIVHYATTRREADPRLAQAESFEPGVPGVVVKLWTLGADGRPNTADDVVVDNYRDGLGTDRWEHPSGCDVLDSTGGPVVPEPDLPVGPACLEFAVLGNETKDGTFDGGYSFTDICPPPDGWPCADADRVLLDGGEYVVGIEVPKGYEVVKEEDVNAAAGQVALGAPPACVGDPHLVPAGSTSMFKGETRPLCDKRRVTLAAGRRTDADFFVFTGVPAPGRVFGLVNDRFDVEADTSSPRYGEARALARLPVGIRDYSYRVLTTVSTDEFGFFEALLPAAQSSDCAVASAVCTATYLFVFNDPGDPARPNPDFDPGYATEQRVVEVLPGTTTRLETRLDPTAGNACVDRGGPEFFSVDKVAIPRSGTEAERRVTIRGLGFGEERINPESPDRPGAVVLAAPAGDRQELPADVYVGWSDTEIALTIPAVLAPGPYQLLVRAPVSSGRTAPLETATGITLHWLGRGYDPPRRYVDARAGSDAGTGRERAPFKTIQRAVDASAPGTLIVVKPGVYRENVIVSRRVKLQGLGPGGLNGPTFALEPGDDPRRRVAGSVIHAAFFNSDPVVRSGWYARLARLDRAGLIGHPDPSDRTVPRGAGLTVVARAGTFSAGLGRALVDGFAIHSARMDARGGGGSGIFVNGFARHLRLSNNLIAGNHGDLGGGIVVGAPFRRTAGDIGNGNERVAIQHNRIVENGGRTFAGGSAIFAGADGYAFENNRVCSNVSARQGGAISHYGKSDGGRILENEILSNRAADEGGGITVTGQQVPAGTPPSGTGTIDVARNVLSRNVAGSDAAALLVRDARTFRIGIRNNILANNSAGGSGALLLADSSNVRILNNTFARNTSTATCQACLGSGLHSAGLASTVNSPNFQAALPAGSAPFSSPVLLNNVFWENEAFTFDLAALPALHGGPPLRSHSFADFEIVGNPELYFTPRFSVLSIEYAGADETNAVFSAGTDPFVLAAASQFAVGFNSKTGEIATGLIDPSGASAGNLEPRAYHLCDPEAPPGACLGDARLLDSGAESVVASTGTIAPVPDDPILAPSIDIDRDKRPLDGNGDGTAGIDLGADELAPTAPPE